MPPFRDPVVALSRQSSMCQFFAVYISALCFSRLSHPHHSSLLGVNVLNVRVSLVNNTLAVLQRVRDAHAIPQLNLGHDTIADPQHTVGLRARLCANIALGARAALALEPARRLTRSSVVEAEGACNRVLVGGEITLAAGLFEGLGAAKERVLAWQISIGEGSNKDAPVCGYLHLDNAGAGSKVAAVILLNVEAADCRASVTVAGCWAADVRGEGGAEGSGENRENGEELHSD
jgi:hypothetical protein